MRQRTLIVSVAVAVVAIYGILRLWPGSGFGRKTLWDWLQLVIIPLALASVGYLLNKSQKNREERIAERNRTQDQEIAQNREQEAVLETYLGHMGTLLVDKHLRKPGDNAEVGHIARVQTLTALRRLNGSRKAIIVQFLYESGLIDKGKEAGSDRDKRVIDLNWADLSGVTLTGAYLPAAYLGGAELSGADLSAATLDDADLYEAHLHGANLSHASLCRANLASAILEGTDLTDADLRDADLRGADLTDATVTESTKNPVVHSWGV